MITTTDNKLQPEFRLGSRPPRPYFAWCPGYPGSYHISKESAQEAVVGHARQYERNTDGDQPYPQCVLHLADDWTVIKEYEYHSE